MLLSVRNIGSSRRTTSALVVSASVCVLLLLGFCQEKHATSVSVPIVLDHNRMLVGAEIQRKDGSWRKARLWVDTGNPNFFMSESLAHDLGFDLSAAGNSTAGMSNLEVSPPSGIRIQGMMLDFKGVKSKVMFQPFWLFSTMHNDGNLPSTVLKQYHVVFDYPNLQLTIAEPGSLKPRGIPSPASVNPKTGIVQIDAVIDGDSLSFALDNGWTSCGHNPGCRRSVVTQRPDNLLGPICSTISTFFFGLTLLKSIPIISLELLSLTYL